MRSVYIFNRNHHRELFDSLLMVNLNSLGVQFNNIHTTKTMFFNNIALFIPEQGIAAKGIDYIIDVLLDNNYLFNFKVRIVICVSKEDCDAVKAAITSLGGYYNTSYYVSDSYNTLLAKIVSSDCEEYITNGYNNKTTKKRIYL